MKRQQEEFPRLSQVTPSIPVEKRPASTTAGSDQGTRADPAPTSGKPGAAQTGGRPEANNPTGHGLSAIAAQLFQRARLLGGQADYQGALIACNQVVAMAPNNVDVLHVKADLLYRLDRYEQALPVIVKVLRFAPAKADYFQLRAGILIAMGRFSQGLQDQDKAAELAPDDPTIRAGRALTYLRLGHFAKGWEDYHWRFLEPTLVNAGFKKPDFPAWTPKCQAKGVLIWREQGIGEDLFFGSLLAEASAFGSAVYARIDERLLPLFMRSVPGIHFITRQTVLRRRDIDAQLPMGDLGKYLRPDPEALKRHQGHYLRPDAQRVEHFKKQLSEPGRLTVGVSWRSQNQKQGTLNKAKSLDLMALKPLLALPQVNAVNLQYGEVQPEIDHLFQSTGLRVRNDHGVDLFNDIDGLAALAAACDVVVTSSSVTAHIAGALGKKGWVLLPKGRNRFWFWHVEDGPSPWYPSLTLVTQSAPGDWSEAVLKVRDALLCEPCPTSPDGPHSGGRR